MLTLLSPDLPLLSPVAVASSGTLEQQVEQVRAELRQAREDHRKLIEAIVAWHERLNGDGSLQIADATIDGTPIGADTPDTGAFTTLAVSTSSTFPKSNTTPTVTSSTGTLTTVSATLNYTSYGDRVAFDALITLTTNGTGGGYLILPLPVTPAASQAGSGRIPTLALTLDVGINVNGTALIRLYDGTYPGADGRTYQISGVYRV